jgi:Zn-dependent peptidase ImmA (M78 family)
MADKMPITPEVLVWARQRSGRTLDDMSDRFRRLSDWESGVDQPSYAQLSRIATIYNLPVAVFFLPIAPREAQIRNNFRTLPDSEIESLPPIMRKLLRQAQAMQLNLAELQDKQDVARPNILSDLQFEPGVSVHEMAALVRSYLSVTVEEVAELADAKEAFEHWRDRFVDAGIYVFKQAFRDDRFSGFCLYDPSFPVIYVNNSTTATRQLFTLFHELSHLFFCTGGIDKIHDDYLAMLTGVERRIEIVCNQFAGALLVPDEDIDRLLARMPATEQTVAWLAGRYKVSRAVILRKMLDRTLVTQEFYDTKTQEWDDQIATREGAGGNYYNTQMSYLGRQYISLALSQYYQNRISTTQLAEYLSVKLKNLPRFEAAFLERKL